MSSHARTHARLRLVHVLHKLWEKVYREIDRSHQGQTSKLLWTLELDQTIDRFQFMSFTIARRSRSRNDNKSNGESYEREIETRERNIRFTGGTKISVRQLLAVTLYRFLIVIARKLIKLTITIGTTGQTVLVNNVACVIRACLR